MSLAQRPYIHINFALDCNGKMGSDDGKSQSISSSDDWRRVHALRERYHAVAVGARTWQVDKPRLNARASKLGRDPLWQPDRVIFCGGHACEIQQDMRQTYVVGRTAPQAEGTLFIYNPGWELTSALATLSRQGLGSMLVEGGATLLKSFIEQQCYDRITIYVRCHDTEAAKKLAYAAFPGLPEMVVEEQKSGVLLGWKKPESTFTLNISGVTQDFKIMGKVNGSKPAHSNILSSRNALGNRAKANLPTEYGDFDIRVYEDSAGSGQHVALVLGNPTAEATPPLIRLHSECLTGDVFGSLRCDCGPQLKLALNRIREYGHGVLLYLRQEGRGIGLLNKVRAYALQERGLDTVEANLQLGFPSDMRDYSYAARVLQDMGIWNVRLLTNNPLKMEALEKNGVRVVERVPLAIEPGLSNEAYLQTKKDKMGHLLV